MIRAFFMATISSLRNKQGIMCTIDTRDRVSIDTGDRHLDRPAIDTRSTSRSTLNWHTVDISVDRLSIFVDTLSSGDRY